MSFGKKKQKIYITDDVLKKEKHNIESNFKKQLNSLKENITFKRVNIEKSKIVDTDLLSLPRKKENDNIKSGELFFVDDLNKTFEVIKLNDKEYKRELSNRNEDNYIKNPDFSSGIYGYIDFCKEFSINITDNKDKVLRGFCSGLIKKEKGSQKDKYIKIPFELDRADLGKIINISFDYDCSEKYIDGDVVVSIGYDTDKEIELDDKSIFSKKGLFFSNFQSLINNSSYYIKIKVASDNKKCYDLIVDNFKVSPIFFNFDNREKIIIKEKEIISTRYTTYSGQLLDLEQNIVYEDMDQDTSNCYDSEKGIYLVKESGWYDIEANALDRNLEEFKMGLFIDGKCFKIKKGSISLRKYLKKDNIIEIKNKETKQINLTNKKHYCDFSVFKI